jgi:two-component system KDP operon response regulator KdpE
MSKDNTILIIDDEIQIRRLLEITLESNGYEVIEAINGKEGINLAASHQPALVILDLGLPDGSGHTVLKQLREWYTSPVIILSVQSNEEDIVKALDNGANDFLIKPFRTGELLARIRSALRSMKNTEENNAIFDFGDLQADLASRIVKKKNEIVKLTATEYKLISLFIQQAGKVLTHQYLLREVWGPGYINQSQYLRVFIAQLRKKIEDDPNRPVYIITEPGVGYRFTATN